MKARSFFKALKVDSIPSPYDVIHYRVIYPAIVKEKKLQGLEPVDNKYAPFPVVIFFNGAFCSSPMYQSLLSDMVERGLVAIIYDWITKIPPDNTGLSPGINAKMWMPDNYGTAPTALALPLLLAELDNLQSEGVLAGTLDLQKIILGGHSAGGKLALENSNPKFFPQVVAAFAYGCDSAAFTMLGYEPGTILPLPSSVPVLLMGGTCDGVISYIGKKWCGIDSKDATNSIVRTFKEGFSGNRNDTYLVLLEGANHFSITDFLDPTIHATELDFPNTQPQDKIHALMTDLIGNFIEAHVREQPKAAEKFNQLLELNNHLIASFDRK